MKLMHLSDLHIGKRVNDFPMLEDQKYILTAILGIADGERPDAVLICGDVYDKSVPSAEAVELFDEFLTRLSRLGHPVFILSGNHDSPERLAFGGRLMDAGGVHLSPVYNGTVPCFSLRDGYGTVRIHMLPFIKPVHVRAFFPEEDISSYTDAVNAALRGIDVSGEERNVLLTHQFVSGGERSESEDISVGGTDSVDSSAFDGFDYVALGHLHTPQNVGSERIRYCGTPLKYSFSEIGRGKSVTIAELREKGSLTVRTVPLVPRHDMREIRGTFAEVTARDFIAAHGDPEDYLHVILTDEDDVPEALGRLRKHYPNLMRMEYDNCRTRSKADLTKTADVNRSPMELFAEFFAARNGAPMSAEQRALTEKLIEEIWEEEL